MLRSLVLLLLSALIVGCTAAYSDVTPTSSAPGVSPIAGSDSPSPSETAFDVASDVYLRLDIRGLPIFYDPRAFPPIVEVTPTAIHFVDLNKDRDPSRLAQLERISIDSSTFDRILNEAREAGVVGQEYFWDHDDNAPTLISHTLTIVVNKEVSANVYLQGMVADNESGPDAKSRTVLWNFINRLINPMQSYATTGAVAYTPDRLIVFADALDPAMIGDMNVELLDWTVTEQPTEWTVMRLTEETLKIPSSITKCRVFAGADAAAVRAALAPLPLGRAWLDKAGAPWAMTSRPVTASESLPCD